MILKKRRIYFSSWKRLIPSLLTSKEAFRRVPCTKHTHPIPNYVCSFMPTNDLFFSLMMRSSSSLFVPHVPLRRTSILEVRRALPSIDTGYYDCRASNAVAFEPVIARTRVIVMRPQVPVQSTEPIPEKWPTTPAPTSSFWSLSGKDRPFSGMPEWAVRPCPLPDFCLNKGQCFYYESVGEYVCQWVSHHNDGHLSSQTTTCD